MAQVTQDSLQPSRQSAFTTPQKGIRVDNGSSQSFESPGASPSSDAESAYDKWTENPTPPSRRRSSISGTSSVSHVTTQATFDHLPFDEEFQRLVSGITDERILKEESAFRSLSRLALDFRFAAMTYGKVIVAEKHIPEAEKTIKPCGNLPGLAGGEKYLAGGILFRFAVDRNNIYGSDGLAGKEAAHQLRGLTEVVSAGVEGLHFPLMALLDYRGYRLLAVSRLPINGNQTLVIGSEDAGGRILEGTPETRSRVSALAKSLNLKPHRVKDHEGNIFELDGPCDLEVHQGPEGRLYAVDFARLFPPEAPDVFGIPSVPKRLVSFDTEENIPAEPSDDDENNAQCRAPHLVRLLRPELVRTNPRPLSSDAYSHFGPLDRQQNDAEVKEATLRLRDMCIPAAAKALGGIEVADVVAVAKDLNRWRSAAAGGGDDDGALNFVEYHGVGANSRDGIASLNANGRVIVSTLHKNGVNMRHIGRVYALASTKWQKQLLNEAVARCVKARVRRVMRRTMRRVRTAVLTPFLACVADELNLTLGAPLCNRPSATVCSCKAACRCLCLCLGSNLRGSPSNSVSETQSVSNMTMHNESVLTQEGAASRHKWWCQTLPQMLTERFGFGEIRSVLLLSPTRNPAQPTRCQCCACGFARFLTRPVVFTKIVESCGLVLSPPTYTGLIDSLARSSSPSRPLRTSTSTPTTPSTPMRRLSPLSFNVNSSPSDSSRRFSNTASPPPAILGDSHYDPPLFDSIEPFDEGSITDVLGSIKVLPYLDYATGTALLIRARNMKNAGSQSEASRLARAAKESFDAGLAQCPTDPRLLSNLAFLIEDVLGDPEVALKTYEESVAKNPMHARSHYYLALCLWRKYQKQAKRLQEHSLLDRVSAHFTSAVECSPWNANVLKDFARFKLRHRPREGDLALDMLHRAIEVEPGHLRALEALGLYHEEKKQPEKATEFWRTLSEVKCSLPESIQARVYLVRNLLQVGQVDPAMEVANSVVEDMQAYRMHSRGHSDRPNAAWACKASRLLIDVAGSLAAKRRACCQLVHELFEVASHLFSWFPPVVNEKRLDKAAQRDVTEMRKAHVSVLTTHGNHVFYCDCQDIDHLGLATELFDRAIQIDPTTPATAWAKERFENQTEGREAGPSLVLVKSDRSSPLQSPPTAGSDVKWNTASSTSAAANGSFAETVKRGGAINKESSTRSNPTLKKKEPNYVLRTALPPNQTRTLGSKTTSTATKQ